MTGRFFLLQYVDENMNMKIRGWKVSIYVPSIFINRTPFFFFLPRSLFCELDVVNCTDHNRSLMMSAGEE
jgi:hypothetical protein